MTGDPAGARAEVASSVERLFACAAWADKHDGAVHHTPLRNVTLAMNEAVGTVGVLCPDEAPLLAFVTLVGGAIAMGNTVVVVPSERHPLAATDFYQVLETSDVPAGVVNIVTGVRDELAKVLAEHADVDAAWYFGGPEGAALVERASVGNLKQTWTASAPLDWTNADLRELLRHATQVKNIWVPYGA
jgi:aldehyde dehydrogenase (NAD+)